MSARIIAAASLWLAIAATFRFQTRRSDGSFGEPISGHWTIDKKAGGGLVEDRFRPDDTALPIGVSLYSYRVYDPERKLRQIAATRAGR